MADCKYLYNSLVLVRKELTEELKAWLDDENPTRKNMTEEERDRYRTDLQRRINFFNGRSLPALYSSIQTLAGLNLPGVKMKVSFEELSEINFYS